MVLEELDGDEAAAAQEDVEAPFSAFDEDEQGLEVGKTHCFEGRDRQ